MKSLKILKIEVNGITDVINGYNGLRGLIGNYLSNLKESLNKNDVEAILYNLEQINKWYADNSYKIQTNPYVTNFDEHKKNMELLVKLYENIKAEAPQLEQGVSKKDFPKLKIFLSHSSKDRKYTDAIRNFLSSLGLKNDQLIYTSHPLHKIPINRNIYEYLRENINDNVYIVVFMSENYLESPACLNEMGAAWVVKSDYTLFFEPNFDFNNNKFHQIPFDTNRMGPVLNGNDNCAASLIEFKDKICEMFNLKIEEKEFHLALKKILEEIK